MSNPKPLNNGHNPPKTLSQSQSAIRSRLFRQRRKRGAVILQAEIEASMISELCALGWLHPLERANRAAVTSAIGAIIFQSLGASMRPLQPGKAFVPVDLKAIEAAIPWIKPGVPVTPENMGQALSNVSKCAAQVGFDGPEYASRAREMAGIN